MNTSAIIFLLVSVSVMRALLLGGAETGIGAPAIEIPENLFEFEDLTCDLVICLDAVGQVWQNVGIFVVDFFTAGTELLVGFVELVIFILRLNLTPFPDTPWYVNALLYTPLAFLIGLLVMRLLKAGKETVT